MQLIPTKYFITSGKATSKTSSLNAFDLALKNAGICEQNLVPVSSVIPDGAEKIDPIELPMGAVTHCVLSQISGKGKDIISAGIACAYRRDEKGGYVAEGHLQGPGKRLLPELEKRIREMAIIRNTDFKEVRFFFEEMEVPEGMYGCCLAALVFTEYK